LDYVVASMGDIYTNEKLIFLNLFIYFGEIKKDE